MEMSIGAATLVVLNELWKKRGLKTELIPLFNIISGIVANLMLTGFNTQSVANGIVVGLVASGLYDQSKICKLIKNEEEKLNG